MNSVWLFILLYLFTAVIFERGGANYMAPCKPQDASADSLV